MQFFGSDDDFRARFDLDTTTGRWLVNFTKDPFLYPPLTLT